MRFNENGTNDYVEKISNKKKDAFKNLLKSSSIAK